MKLYQTNQMIEELINSLQPDPETGELPDNTDEIIKQLNGLEAEREDILKWIVESCLNLRGEIAGIKAEEERLYKIRKHNEAVADRLIRVLDHECGENKDFGIAKLTYRKTTKTDIFDPEKAVNYLQSSGYDDALKYAPPAIDRAAVKKLIKSGVAVPGAELVNSVSVTLR